MDRHRIVSLILVGCLASRVAPAAEPAPKPPSALEPIFYDCSGGLFCTLRQGDQELKWGSKLTKVLASSPSATRYLRRSRAWLAVNIVLDLATGGLVAGGLLEAIADTSNPDRAKTGALVMTGGLAALVLALTAYLASDAAMNQAITEYNVPIFKGWSLRLGNGTAPPAPSPGGP